MFKINYQIQIGSHKLNYVDKVEIHKSVNVLVQTAVITVPAVRYNKSSDYEDKFKVGDAVSIQLGYNDNLQQEFKGYLQRIDTDNDVLTLNCEDEMYKLRVPLKDKVMNNAKLADIINYCIQGKSIKVDNQYDYTCQKFTIKSKNILDVLGDIKQETNARIYLDGEGTLCIHEPFTDRSQKKTINYDFAKNIESSSLKYKKKDDKKVEVEIQCCGADGKMTKISVGASGGEKHVKKLDRPTDQAGMKKIGNSTLNMLWYDGYQGSIDSWLVPSVQPGDSAKITDNDYPYKNGTYYVAAVTTEISSSGGKRKIEISLRLG